VTTRYLTIEGCHATGSSTHADALAAALRDAGHDAVSWHHPRHPDGATGLARVEHYIDARRVLWALRNAVVVVDRGPFSGLVHARACVAAYVPGAPGDGLAAMDCATFGSLCAVAYLDVLGPDGAPDDATLDARLLLRGEDPRESHHERAQWRRLAAAERWPVVDTSGPREATGAALLTWALRVLA